MKKLLILSGKGGTGKTTTAGAFIHFASAKAFADCDVDAPNLHIVANLADSEPITSDYYGSKKATIDSRTCTGCGICMERCRFDAIRSAGSHYEIDEYGCEGCGVCEFSCPKGAITLENDVAGHLALYQDEATFSTAKLKMGRGNSGKLVAAVKASLKEHAPETDLAIIDGSPGIGCPVIASINGVDLVLIVAEPSLSGMSDMERILKTAAIFRTPTAVCVNKYDTSVENAEKIQAYCKSHDIPFMGMVPYDKQASTAINTGQTLAQIDCAARNALYQIYENTVTLLTK